MYSPHSWIEEDKRKSWKGLSTPHSSTRQLDRLICPHPHPLLSTFLKPFFLTHFILLVPLIAHLTGFLSFFSGSPHSIPHFWAFFFYYTPAFLTNTVSFLSISRVTFSRKGENHRLTRNCGLVWMRHRFHYPTANNIFLCYSNRHKGV